MINDRNKYGDQLFLNQVFSVSRNIQKSFHVIAEVFRTSTCSETLFISTNCCRDFSEITKEWIKGERTWRPWNTDEWTKHKLGCWCCTLIAQYIYKDSKLLASLMKWYICFPPGLLGAEIESTGIVGMYAQTAHELV